MSIDARVQRSVAGNNGRPYPPLVAAGRWELVSWAAAVAHPIKGGIPVLHADQTRGL